MSDPSSIRKISSFKTPEAFRGRVAELGLEIPCASELLSQTASPLSQPIEEIRINGKRIGNRYAVQPMEGWDGTPSGGITENVCRRWRRFGETGAKLICGGEAMAVRRDGRANPSQLVINEVNQNDLARLFMTLLEAHRQHFGAAEEPVIGFQL